MLRNEEGADEFYGLALDELHGRRSRLHLHHGKQQRVMMSSEERENHPMDRADKEQEPACSVRVHGVEEPRKKKEADKDINGVLENNEESSGVIFRK